MMDDNRYGLGVLGVLLCLGWQRAKEYYEQTLMQELKKNQELYEYIRLMESRIHHPDRDCAPANQVVYLLLENDLMS